jgi:hypothetical protein
MTLNAIKSNQTCSPVYSKSSHLVSHSHDIAQITTCGGDKARPEQVSIGYRPNLFIRQDQDNAGIMHERADFQKVAKFLPAGWKQDDDQFNAQRLTQELMHHLNRIKIAHLAGTRHFSKGIQQAEGSGIRG